MSPPLTDEQSARVERHTELVRRIASLVHRQWNRFDVDELASVGYEALIGAAIRYDPTSGASFATYAHYRVRGAMIDSIRAAKPAGRRFTRAKIRLEQCQALLEQASTDQSVREAAGRSTLEERVVIARDLLRKAAMINVMSECQGAVIDQIDGSDPDPEHALLDRETHERAEALIEELEPTERRLVTAIYKTGQTMAQYAAEKGTSSATISRRHAKILERLAKRARASE